MYFMQRDMSCVNLALCLPCPFSQSLMWRIGGWVEGQVFAPPYPPLTSYCFPVRLHWHFKKITLFWFGYWNTLGCYEIIFIFCHFWWVFLFDFSIPRTWNPIFLLWKIIFPPMEKYITLNPPPPIPSPLHLQYCSLHGLQLALSKAIWTNLYDW